jgi:hypothetical protein
MKLGEINMAPLIIQNKIQGFNTGYNFSLIIYKYMINIDYYMAFFISYPLSALEPIGSMDDIRMRADKGYEMKSDML